MDAKLRELGRLWSASGRITDYYARETRTAICEAAADGLTPAEIAKAVKMSKGWVEECLLSEYTGYRV